MLMRSQVRAMGLLLLWVWDCNTTQLANVQALLAQEKPFLQIDEICRRLDSTKVDAELVAGEEGHTLYDFVDDTSVSSLKLQAQVDLKEMFALHEKGQAAQVVFEDRLVYFRQVILLLLLLQLLF
jgi:hypothetical protein